MKTPECKVSWTELQDHLAVVVEISDRQINKLKDTFWKTYCKHLKIKGFRPGRVPALVAKKLNIDPDLMSKPVINQYAIIEFSKMAPRPIIWLGDPIDNNSQITFDAWLEPSVILDAKVLGELKFKVPKPQPDQYIKDRQTNFAHLNPYMKNKVDDQGNPIASAEGDMVEVGIHCIVDGKEFNDAHEPSTNIRLFRNIVQPPSLFDRLIGVLPTQSFTLETDQIPPAWVQQLHGKTIKLEVQVNRVYSCEEAEINDDMAITAGFNNLEEWTRSIKDSFYRIYNHQILLTKKQLVLSALIKASTVPDFPDMWLDEKIKELQHLNDPDIRNKIHEVAKHTAILKTAGGLAGIQWDDGDKPIGERNQSVYADKVLTTLTSQAIFEEVGSVDSLSG